MSAIGFTPQLNEIDELRKAYGALNDVIRNLRNVRECLRREEWRMADHHLRAADWHLDQENSALRIQIGTVVGLEEITTDNAVKFRDFVFEASSWDQE